jgi:hypothetical protein
MRFPRSRGAIREYDVIGPHETSDEERWRTEIGRSSTRATPGELTNTQIEMVQQAADLVTRKASRVRFPVGFLPSQAGLVVD